jgi:hypothetical protein
LIVISGITFWRVRRDKTLLRDGALTAAVVTHQKRMAAGGRGGGRKHSRIRYRFKDASGQMFQGTDADDSLTFFVDMIVPVFYNPENPERNVAMCSALCELRFD